MIAPLPLLGTAILASSTLPGSVGLGEAVAVGPVSITPLAVGEDSRCPEGVFCVWEGRLVLEVRINDGETHWDTTFVLGEALELEGGKLLFVEATPAASEGEKADILSKARFSFSFKSA